MTERKTTSIKINPDLWIEARQYAIGKGISVSDLIEKLIKKEISKNHN